ncbi:MAG TPA: amidohydrolase family protein [Chitinophagaceae bacterium]|nr:amidohydrolase family protein [Chitinophagaceae bacterium]
MRLLYTIIGCVFLLAANQKKNSPRKIIDVHFHARLLTDYPNPPPPNPVTGKIPEWKNDKEMMGIMLAALKDNNVVRVIASGNLTTVANFQMADPDRVIPGFDYPFKGNNSLPDTASFVRYIQEGKLSVFGELALQYEGKTLADPELEPYLAICERLGIPVALHTGMSFPNTPYTCCPKFRTHLGNPQLIEEVLVMHPKLKIQLMHLGFPYLQETKAIMNVYPQVYADIAAIDWLRPVADFYSYLKSLIDAGFGKRIMYGSDQMAWEDAIPLAIKNVENAPFLTEAQKQDIFYNNAAKFYNIK